MNTDDFEEKIAKINSDLELAHECSKSAENIANVLKDVVIEKKEEK